MWEFHISTSPTSQAIPPWDPDSQDDEPDSLLPPIELHRLTDCNCFNLPINPVCPDGHPYTPIEKASSGSSVDGEPEGGGAVNVENKIEDICTIITLSRI